MIGMPSAAQEANFRPVVQVQWELPKERKTFQAKGWIDLPSFVTKIFHEQLKEGKADFKYTLADYVQSEASVKDQGQLYADFKVRVDPLTGNGYQISDRSNQKAITASSYQREHTRAVRVVQAPDLLVDEEGAMPLAKRMRK